VRRVLLVTHRAVPGGAQRLLAAVAPRLRAHGWEPVAALGEPGPIQRSFDGAGVPVHVVAGEEEVDAVARGAGAVLGLCAEGHRLGGPAAARLGIPAVWWRMLTPRGRPYEHAAAAIPVAAVACLTATAVPGQRALTPGAPVEVVPAGIDVGATAARRGAGRALRARIAPDGPLVGIVGRLDPAKGQDDFLRAATGLPRARFAVVGGAIVGHEGDFEARLHALARELGIEDRVTFAGHVGDPLMWIDALDVAVVASHHEAFGLVCVEALALGVPVVATATDGPAAILRAGGGVLVPPRDPAALADAIGRVLDARAPRGPAALAEPYDVALTARRLATLLDRVSGAPRGRAGSAAARDALPAGA